MPQTIRAGPLMQTTSSSIPAPPDTKRIQDNLLRDLQSDAEYMRILK